VRTQILPIYDPAFSPFPNTGMTLAMMSRPCNCKAQSEPEVLLEIRKGVDFGAMDGKAAHLFLVLFAPEDSAATHLKVLSKISRLLKDSSFRQRLMNAAGGHELYMVLAEEDEEL
jgi:mannitol/fructose-specific phosphotransferase system IIA component (Ntr-type)